MIPDTIAKARKQIRITAFPVEWKSKYPRIYVARWLAAGIVVAVLTGNAQLGKLNPFGSAGLKGSQSALGQSVTSIVAYPIPLTVAVTKWAGKEANHLCTTLSISCDINPTRNLHYKFRNPLVKQPTGTATSANGNGAAQSAAAPHAP
jgi:hypothetical protein